MKPAMGGSRDGCNGTRHSAIDKKLTKNVKDGHMRR